MGATEYVTNPWAWGSMGQLRHLPQLSEPNEAEVKLVSCQGIKIIILTKQSVVRDAVTTPVRPVTQRTT